MRWYLIFLVLLCLGCQPSREQRLSRYNYERARLQELEARMDDLRNMAFLVGYEGIKLSDEAHAQLNEQMLKAQQDVERQRSRLADAEEALEN